LSIKSLKRVVIGAGRK
jgi:hypothetical protein